MMGDSVVETFLRIPRLLLWRLCCGIQPAVTQLSPVTVKYRLDKQKYCVDSSEVYCIVYMYVYDKTRLIKTARGLTYI